LLADIDPTESSDDDEYYDFQLIGSSVSLIDGTEVGEVSDVIHLPAQNLLAFRYQEREILIPFIHQFVPKVDIKSKQIVITPPPGLIDELADEISDGGET
jgi:16S rRNA processing protein RimM